MRCCVSTSRRSKADVLSLERKAITPLAAIEQLGIVAATFLVDGRVAGTWELARAKDSASIRLRPFGRLSAAVLAAVRAEALLRWHEPDARKLTIR